MGEIKYNLHNHTYFSDGELSPTGVVELNKKQGYNVIAITDHDSVEGIAEAVRAGERLGVLVIPGVEVSTARSHMLGLFVDYKNPELLGFLKQRRLREKEVSNYIIKGLAGVGYKLTPELISRTTNAQLLNPWKISLALVRLGLVNDEKTARDLVRKVPWLKVELPGTRSASGVSEREAIKLIRGAEGVPILAHPLSNKKQRFRYLQMPFRAFMLKRAGLAGLEVQHPDHSRFERAFLHSVSTLLSLHKTGGADFHNDSNGQMKHWGEIHQSKGVRNSIRALRMRK